MRKLLPIIIFFLFLSLFLGPTTSAQPPDANIKRTYHWYFGYGAGFDFSNGTPALDTSSNIYEVEATITMSDTCGNLLFYSSSDSIWTKQHTLMPNGTIDNPGTPGQMICVPQPGNDSLYYVFYAKWSDQTQYAIINMNKNSGLGAVVTKDNALYGIPSPYSSEKITATPHCNGQDYWIAGKAVNNDSLLTWKLTPNGLDTIPVVSEAATWSRENGDGQLKFSPDGSMAAAAYITQSLLTCDSNIIELYQFDDCTGQFSSPIPIRLEGSYGVSFSPDNSTLYAGVNDECLRLSGGAVDSGYLAQFDVSVYDSAAIVNSKTIIASGSSKAYLDLQLAPDGRLYVADVDTNKPYFGYKLVGVINSPNKSGMSCKYQQDTIGLGGKFHNWGFPCYIENYFNGINSFTAFNNCDSSNFVQEQAPFNLQVYPNPVSQHLFISGTAKNIQAEVAIYNLKGEKTVNKEIQLQTNSKINISRLPAGVYLIKVITKDHNTFSHFRTKIVKL